MLSKKDQRFDRLAFIYDFLVKLVFGKSLKKAQTHFLGELPSKAKLLILGGGTGWILEEIEKRRPELELVYVEASEKMLALAKKKRGKLKVNFIHGNEQMIPEGDTYDAVLTPFFLDLFGPVRLFASMSLIDQVLSKEGTWFFVDFYVPKEKGLKSMYAKGLIYIMYRFFRILCGIDAHTLPDFDQAFQMANYRLKKQENFHLGMVSSRIYVKK
ncbi:MAG: class I SAM-dependent methyltransferase [Bacteroidia bacterium]|nr:class I SAM-dependent methyltransferase [Bacteroidia bacterium]